MSRGGYRPGAGRKPSRGTRATERIEIRATEAELAELMAAAGKADLGPWILEAALAWARRQR